MVLDSDLNSTQGQHSGYLEEYGKEGRGKKKEKYGKGEKRQKDVVNRRVTLGFCP